MFYRLRRTFALGTPRGFLVSVTTKQPSTTPGLLGFPRIVARPSTTVPRYWLTERRIKCSTLFSAAEQDIGVLARESITLVLNWPSNPASMSASGRTPTPQLVESVSSILAAIKRYLASRLPKSDLALSLLPADAQRYVDVLYECIFVSSEPAGAGTSPSRPFDDLTLPHARRFLRALSNEHGVLPSPIMLDAIELVYPEIEDTGGFARVKRGHHNGRFVAVKILHPGSANSMKRSCREAATWSMISHPYTLPLLGVYASGDGACMTMVSPWCRNGNLEQYLAGGHHRRERDRLLKEIAEALVYLHTQNIIHDDLHPKNVLIDDNQHAQVADFGISDFVDATVSNSIHGEGIPDYVAPENYGLAQQRQKASDVFSFGSVGIFVYTVRPPFNELRVGLHPRRAKYVVANAVMMGERPPRPTDTQCGGPGAGLSDNLWALVQQCWLHNPAARPSAADVLRRLCVVFGRQAV